MQYPHGPAAMPARPSCGPTDRSARRLAPWMVGLPCAGFVAALCFAALHGFTRLDAALLAGMYLLTGLGVEAGLHRHFCHRAFKAGPVLRAVLAVAGSMAAQGPLLFWVATHRLHHRHADCGGDPHSPRPRQPGRHAALQALWHAHLGWLFTLERSGWAEQVAELLSERRLLWLSRGYFAWVALGLLLPGVLGAMLGSGWRDAVGGLLWGGFARIFLLQHATWAINSLGHRVGGRPHPTRDDSRNIALLALPTLGGSWHNNHHAHPGLACNDERPWQLDPSAWFIRALEAAGLVWDVRRAPRAEPGPTPGA
ncbi:acyl-CoA desaturase [Aquabacterium sp. A7-Y]|uniref:acyl-CoA desaturase n=1 Tax=Aquabacterium sp. A7-Y TaxID=1349605 RepID=UPI00223D0001|nr:acyl-CoA desaturase [Aquabacterium sp. A7-Y]MCW7541933.1 acyl-CoA desaturase [Aquabacterium sp. A7-Y]